MSHITSLQFLGIIEVIIITLAIIRLSVLIFCQFYKNQHSQCQSNNCLLDTTNYAGTGNDYFDTSIGISSLTKTGQNNDLLDFEGNIISDNLYDEPRCWITVLKGGNPRYYVDSSYKIGNWGITSLSAFGSMRGSSMGRTLSFFTTFLGCSHIITSFLLSQNVKSTTIIQQIILAMAGIGLCILGQFDDLRPIPQSLIKATQNFKYGKIIESPSIVRYKKIYSSMHLFGATLVILFGTLAEMWMWRSTASGICAVLGFIIFLLFETIQVLTGDWVSSIPKSGYLVLFPSRPEPTIDGDYTHPNSVYYPRHGSWRSKYWKLSQTPKMITIISICAMITELIAFSLIILSTSIANIQNITY
jgi:hypothetical protein